MLEMGRLGGGIPTTITEFISDLEQNTRETFPLFSIFWPILLSYPFLGAYNKDTAPVEKFPPEDDPRTKVEISVEYLDVTDIDYLKSIFNVRFWLIMRWQDTRVKFIQLEKAKDTILSQKDANKLWLPYLIFETTPKISRTIRYFLLYLPM